MKLKHAFPCMRCFKAGDMPVTERAQLLEYWQELGHAGFYPVPTEEAKRLRSPNQNFTIAQLATGPYF